MACTRHTAAVFAAVAVELALVAGFVLLAGPGVVEQHRLGLVPELALGHCWLATAV